MEGLNFLIKYIQSIYLWWIIFLMKSNMKILWFLKKKNPSNWKKANSQWMLIMNFNFHNLCQKSSKSKISLKKFNKNNINSKWTNLDLFLLKVKFQNHDSILIVCSVLNLLKRKNKKLNKSSKIKRNLSKSSNKKNNIINDKSNKIV